jgi:7-carboxy-7-deazaguanine synthase
MVDYSKLKTGAAGLIVMEKYLVISEIFFSIQGESSFAGIPCAFVRLSHCDLRCSWCDTEYAFYEGEKKSIQTIFEEVLKFPTDLVEITGGEPLLQKNVHSLIEMLLDRGKTVLIETGGHRDVSPVDSRAILIIDLKSPGSRMSLRNRWENLEKLKSADEIKFVIADRNDYEWAKSIIEKYHLSDRHTVLMSPVWDDLSLQELSEWVLSDGLQVRVQIQLHKLAWGPDRRGV